MGPCKKHSTYLFQCTGTIRMFDGMTFCFESKHPRTLRSLPFTHCQQGFTITVTTRKVPQVPKGLQPQEETQIYFILQAPNLEHMFTTVLTLTVLLDSHHISSYLTTTSASTCHHCPYILTTYSLVLFPYITIDE